MNPSSRRASRFRPPAGRAACVALLVTVAAIGCTPQAQAAAIPTSSTAVLSVRDSGGKAAELLRRLTIPQVAAVLKTTPAQLMLEAEASGGTVSAELGELFSNPAATLQEVLDLLAAHGVSTEPLKQALNRLLAGASESAEQLRTTIDAVLGDLSKGGQIGAVASELRVPPAIVETLHLVPSTAEQLAGTLSATTDRLSSVLQGAGAVTRPMSGSTPLVSAPVERIVEGRTTALVGMPTGNGGLSLTTINSTPTVSSATAPPGARVSNAFSIVSIKVTRTGAIQETVKLPGPGLLTIDASTLKRVAVKSRNGRKRSFARRTTVGSAAATVSGGIRTFTLRLKGAKGLPKRVLVRLATTYTPTGGSANTIQRNVIVSRAVATRHH